MSILDLYPDSILSQKESSEKKVRQTKLSLSEDFLNALNFLPQLVWVSKGDEKYCNKSLKQFVGIDTDNITHGEWICYFHPEDAEHIYILFNNAKKTGQRIEKECRIKNEFGVYIWFNLIAESYSNQHNDIDWFVSCTNIHDRVIKLRETTEMLRESTELLDIRLNIIKKMKPSSHFMHMSHLGFKNLFQQEKLNSFGKKLLLSERRHQAQILFNPVKQSKYTRFNGKNFSNNSIVYLENRLKPKLNDHGETMSVVCISHDIPLEKFSKVKLKLTTDFDELTGLMNRRGFKIQLKHSIAQAKKQRSEMGILFIDLDHFRNINDTLGHPAGDHLLKVLSNRLSKCLDLDNDTYLSRIGGDEFAVIVTNIMNIDDFNKVASNILIQLDKPITYSGKIINGGMSIGCAMYPQDARDVKDLMKCADLALNDLKERGRGGIRMYNPGMLVFANKKTDQLVTARMILRENRIEPFYQPKVRLEDHKIIGFEALLRWRDDENAIHNPINIFEAFNDYELASKISEVMHTKIFSDIAEWLKTGINLVPVAINASPVEFMRDDYAELLIQRLESFNIPVNLIEIEITEHVLSDRGSAFVIRALKKLKSHGVRISLDDFGTGHSSMTHLRDYPVDCLKLDCSFVGGMCSDESIDSIVKGITHLGTILSLDVVAEGIETIEQANKLKLFGCEFGQGFLFSHAVCAEAAKQFLIESK